jgi:fatty-acyl-CoA synthase
MAWVTVRAGRPAPSAESVRAFCDGRLARYKIPRYIHIVEAFPMTVTGKVRKVEMREAAVELLSLEQVADRPHA